MRLNLRNQMKARYAPDWVLIGDPVIDEGQRLIAGKVLFHSPDRDNSRQMIRRWNTRRDVMASGASPSTQKTWC